MTREHGLAGMLLFALAWIFFANSARDRHQLRADALEAQIPALELQVEEARQTADSMADSAQRADSVAVALRDSVDAIVAHADTVLVSQLDTITVLVTDTTALRLIAQRDTVWSGIVEAKDSVIAGLDRSVTLWRSTSEAQGLVIASQDSLLATVAGANDALHASLRSKSRRQWGERVVVVGALACVLLCN